ncbi:MAG: caspase family protein [Chitinophagaceae bacterium]|nr:caspase family protein [Chitinophagaceae bacterium]
MNTNLFAIGIDNYAGCRKLNNCVKDIDNIVDLLTDKYHFEKSLITNLKDSSATQTNLIAQFEAYIANQNPAENLVILFSGHGDYDDKLDMGYLLPVDSTLDNKASYLPNSTLFTYIKALEYRHIVLLFDSCFSGSFFPATKGIPTPKEKLFDIPSKWALTSGRMELVSDGIPGANSPFANSVINNLKANTEDLFGISELSGKVILEVTGKHNQIPRGEPLQNLGHKGGEFMFKLRAKKTISVPVPKTTLTESENQIFNIIKAYFDVLLQIEEADNDDKFATANRLIEEANSISKIIRKEIIKNFEFAKNNESSTALFLKILGGEFKTTIEELQELKEQKTK